jgi:hypothetical protein
VRQSAFIGLLKSHAIIRGPVKFVHLTVLIQEPKMRDKMYKKWHVVEIFQVVSVCFLMVAMSRNMFDTEFIITFIKIYSVGFPYIIILLYAITMCYKINRS